MYNGVIGSIEKTSPLSPDGLTFEINNQPIELYYEWSSNEGEKWTFELVLNHPELDFSITGQCRNKNDLANLLKDLVHELPELQKHFINTAHNLCNDLFQKLAPSLRERMPTSTPEESYFGI